MFRPKPFNPGVRFGKDDASSERQPKDTKRRGKKKWEKPAPVVYKESAAWLEHVQILRRAGYDVYEEERRTMKKLR